MRENYHSNLKKVYLAHMSRDSNDAKLAIDAVLDELLRDGLEISLEVAQQEITTKVIEF